MPQISIIVPIYKVDQYLQRCVDSILVQTFTDYELILIDDGSPDMSGQIGDEYAQQDSRLIVIHKKNGGVSSARNVALDWQTACSDSEWLSFVDSDDWIHKQYLELLYGALQHDSMQKISCCRFREVGSNDFDGMIEESKVIPTPMKTDLDTLFNRNGWGTYICGRLFHQSLFTGVRFDKSVRICEDTQITPALMDNITHVMCIDEPLYYYFINNNSATHAKNEVDSTDRIITYRAVEQFLMFLKRRNLVYSYAHTLSMLLNILSGIPGSCKKALSYRYRQKLRAYLNEYLCLEYTIGFSWRWALVAYPNLFSFKVFSSLHKNDIEKKLNRVGE